MIEEQPLSGIDYFDKLATKFVAERRRASESTETNAAKVVAVKLSTKKIKILDVGCGAGSQWAKRHKQYIIVGLDGSSEMLAAATKSRKFNKLVQVDLDDTDQQWGVPENCFDLVICNDTLLYLSDASNVVKKMLRAAKLGSMLHVAFAESMGTASTAIIEKHLDKETGAVTPVQRWLHPKQLIEDAITQNGGKILRSEPHFSDDRTQHEIIIKKQDPTPP